jgi:magnesium transporter
MPSHPARSLGDPLVLLKAAGSRQFGQRAKLQVYPNGAMLVGFGLDDQLREAVEVHCYCTTGYLITLRRAASPALDGLRQAGPSPGWRRPDPGTASSDQLALHPVRRAGPGAGRTTGYARPAGGARGRRRGTGEISAIHRRAAQVRRTLTPGRDLAARAPLIQSLPGATSETPLYAEDISEQLAQVVTDFTAIEERCSALLGLHSALVSKHLATVSRRLAAVATIFLPISFLAGFWGQNFNVLTGSIEPGWPAFLVLGLGLSLACVAVTVFILRRRNWN